VGTDDGGHGVDRGLDAVIDARAHPGRASRRGPGAGDRTARAQVVVPWSLAVAVELPELTQRLSELALRHVELRWRE
jgi:hypothetical protein